MLVTLGNNQALSASASQTFPYACTSVQKVFIKVDDDATSTGFNVTVQLGQRTIANGVSAYGFLGTTGLQGGKAATNAECIIAIDFGNHELLDNENLYVTINAGSSALTAVDVSALVDEPGGEMPIRYTEYSDNTFTAENVRLAIAYADDQGAIDEDGTNCEVRNSISSSSPTFISASNWYMSTAVNVSNAGYGTLCNNPIPLTTTFNYASSGDVDRILVASQMPTTARAIAQGRRSVSNARKAVTRGRV